MIEDPIVEEVRRARDALAAQEGNDLRRMVAAVRRRQALSGQKVVRREPRRVKAAMNKTA